MMMKAVNMKGSNARDDLFLDRLFSYLKINIPYPLDKIIPIRKEVFLIKSERIWFILKGFSSYKKMKLQEAFTQSLKYEGFKDTYSFYSVSTENPLFFENKYYGCLEYIFPGKEIFSYNNEKDRKLGLQLLNKFHRTTVQLVNRYSTLLPRFQLVEKWHERLLTFQNNLPLIRFFLPKEMVHEIMCWADWSLNNLEKELPVSDLDSLVILHGDVAHHNFLRGANKKLYIIDFDLISIGKESADYLQYANRILPFLNWSYEELSYLDELKPFLIKKEFLIALAFPTDIFREWNRLIREKLYENSNKVRPIIELTISQFNERKNFFEEIVKRTNKMNG